MTDKQNKSDQSNSPTPQPSQQNPFDAYFSSDESNDAFLDGLVRFEQIEARIPNNVKLIATYYNALIESGVPGQIVFVLVRDYATALTYNGY